MNKYPINIMHPKKVLYISFGVCLVLFGSSLIPKSNSTGYLTKDGTWCWFSDPRAVGLDNGNIITGWVKKDGTVEAAMFDPVKKETIRKTLFDRLQIDDHNNPAFTLTAEGDILATYTTHSGKDGFYQNKTKGFDISTFSTPEKVPLLDSNELIRFPKVHVTYANPFRLSSEQERIYCFGRWTGYKPNVMWTDDHGQNWTKSRVMITNFPFDPSNRPYVKYYSDGKSKIHIVFTDGHPRVEPSNSVYYAYYEAGSFYRADGTAITSMQNLPFEVKDASLVYAGNMKEGRAWIADIAQDQQGYPVILYTRSPAETDHHYWYAKYNGQKWISAEICNSGKWFPQTQPGNQERETHYFGNMSLVPSNTDVVYLSRQINRVFEIERWETQNDGEDWDVQAITEKSTYDNVRPFVPRGIPGDSEIVLWMENQEYIHYTKYQTSIKYHIGK